MLDDDRAPLHPMRVYRELDDFLERDAIVVGDGGDFVRFAGRVWETWEPGTWMDPGPYGCLGAGPGQAIGAKLAHLERQVCLLLGDGAFGFSGMEFDTMARHSLPIVAVMGNNGIWAPRAPPDEVPLRLLARRRAPARDPLRRGRLRPRRATASWSAPPTSSARRSTAPSPPANPPGQRAHRPGSGLPAQGEPGVVHRHYSCAYDRARQGAVRGLRAGHAAASRGGGGGAVVRGSRLGPRRNRSLRREFSFPDFREAFGFVARAALIAEAEGHHPDIELGWGRASFELRPTPPPA